MKGPAARFAFDPVVLVEFLDSRADYRVGGHPVRRRRHINGVAVAESDLRLIRRWRSGRIKGVTKTKATDLLHRHGLALGHLEAWAAGLGRQPVLRGQLSLQPTTNRRTT